VLFKGFPKFIKPSKIFNSYWEFATERQSIYFHRISGESPPWTSDPILKTSKFTNAYRAADRTSQYLISKVIYCDQPEEDVILNILLFKLFNKIETWKAICSELGPIKYDNFDANKISKVLQKQLDRKNTIYSAAYILPPASMVINSNRKHVTHLALVQSMLNDGFIGKAKRAKSLESLYNLIRGYPMFGPFLAFQMAVDIAYSNVVDLVEDGFVVPGPGALRGIRKCFESTGGLSASELILLLTDYQSEFFDRYKCAFKDLWGRPLKPIDCQNLFCEFDKYSRVAFPEFNGKSEPTRIKQKYRITGPLVEPWFPPKWGINKNIKFNNSQCAQASLSL